MKRLQNFIAGELREARSDFSLDIVNPSTGTPYLEAPNSSDLDVDAACSAAGSAFEAWRSTTPSERSLALFRIADDLEAEGETLIAAECANTGKPLSSMRGDELPTTIDYLRYYATLARSLPGLSSAQYVRGYDSSVRREPVGVCGQVSPWNYPLMMAIWKIGPALAMGNTVVLKPADTTPVTTVMMAEIAGRHLPAGVLNVIVGDRDTGRSLVAHPRPDLISVTGSVRAGSEISASAAPSLKRVHLELGGKAPVLVFGDVDIDSACAGIASAGYFNAGQDCAAAARVLVHESIYEEFVEKLVTCAKTTRYGSPEEDVKFGPLNSGAQLARVCGFFERMPTHAEVRTGGNADRRDGGYFFEPTVVTGLAQEDEMIQEEIFGPVLTVQRFAQESEALALANGVRFGLAGSIWTRSHETAVRVSARLDFGQVWINCHLTQAAEMPNGGFKHSGHGNDLSAFAIDDYTRVKHVMSKVDLH
jgi:betaine-aldehyde dehydrogenase